MDHDVEYDEAMMTSLELIWGRGFMAPGGEGHVRKMVNGIETQNKRLLDIGTGLGGPAFILAEQFGLRVVGIDIEEHLIEIAKERALEAGLEGRTDFKFVTPGALDFSDASFDIVLSSGAFTQIAKKKEMFAECFRILKPGGTLTCYDWMKPPGAYSQDMLDWFELEGLTYAMETPERHAELLGEVGFTNIEIEDSTKWYRNEAKREYSLLKGALAPEIVTLLGEERADHFVDTWRAMIVVIDKGEMLQVYARGQKAE